MRVIYMYFSPVGYDRIDGEMITGRGLHGLLFNILKKSQIPKTNLLHESGYIKPFSLTPFYSDGGSLVGMRLVGLSNDVADTFTQACNWALESGSIFNIGSQKFLVSKIELSNWIDWVDLLPADVSTNIHIEMRFSSPTAFKQGKTSLLFPIPYNIYLRPYKIWQALGPPAYQPPDHWIQWSKRMVYVPKHQIKTIEVKLDHRNNFTGFVGDIRLEIQSDITEKEYIIYWKALSRLSEYCGVGYKTTMGMGMIELIESD